MKDIKEKIMSMRESLQKAQDEFIRNQGIYDSKIQQLKDDFGYENLEDAKDALSKMKKKCLVLQKRLEEEIHDFEKKYKDLLK